MSDATASSQNVLDEMTAGIMGRKQDRATRLTPVGMERRLPSANAPFPNDQPQEVVEQAIHEIRRQAASLIGAADALEQDVLGKASSVAVIVDPKAAERAADVAHAARLHAAQEGDEKPLRHPDEGFPLRFARLSVEAQGATFNDVEPEETASDWQCPKHGLDSVVMLTSRKGRTYRSCSIDKCKDFEK